VVCPRFLSPRFFNIVLVDNIGAGLGFVNTDSGVACATTGSPFTNDCDYDQGPRAIRRWLF